MLALPLLGPMPGEPDARNAPDALDDDDDHGYVPAAETLSRTLDMALTPPQPRIAEPAAAVTAAAGEPGPACPAAQERRARGRQAARAQGRRGAPAHLEEALLVGGWTLKRSKKHLIYERVASFHRT